MDTKVCCNLVSLSLFQTYAVQSHYGIPHSEVKAVSSVLMMPSYSILLQLLICFSFITQWSFCRLFLTLSPSVCQLAKLHQLSMHQQGLAPISQSATQVLPGT